MSVLCISLFAANLTVFAVTEYVDGYLRYTVAEGSVTITGYNGRESEVTIPAGIAGVPVNYIATGAFSDVLTVTKINLPDSIMSVEEGAFNSGQTVVYSSNIDDSEVIEPEQGSTEGEGKEPEQGTTEEPEQGTTEEPEQEDKENTDKKPNKEDTKKPDKKKDKNSNQSTSGENGMQSNGNLVEEVVTLPDVDITEEPAQVTNNSGSNEIGEAPVQDIVKQPEESVQPENVTTSKEETPDVNFGDEEVIMDLWELEAEAEDTLESEEIVSHKTEETEESEHETAVQDSVQEGETETTKNNSAFGIVIVVVILAAAAIGGYVYIKKVRKS